MLTNSSPQRAMPASFPGALSQNTDALRRFAALSYEEQRRLLPEEHAGVKEALLSLGKKEIN